MISYQEALRILLENTQPLGTERVFLKDAVGRVLASSVVSPEDRPSFDNSAMDGYAVISEDTEGASEDSPVLLKLVGEVPAGVWPSCKVEKKTAVKIFTGAPLPEGADAVVPVEYTQEKDGYVVVKKRVPAGANVRRKGEEFRRGEILLEEGTTLRHYEIALLASINVVQVEVYRRPRVGILSTGDELVDLGEEITSPSQIRTSNNYGLLAGVILAGGEPHLLGIVGDEPVKLGKLMKSIEEYDVFITTGGVSVGERDLVKVLVEEYGVDVKFHKVRIKPAKPVLFGLKGKTLFFGLPGNPVSTMIAFDLLVKPALLKLQGVRNHVPQIQKATLVRDFSRKDSERLEFVRARVWWEGDTFLCDYSPKTQSHMLTSYVGMNAYMIVPEGVNTLREGDRVDVILL
ncbi:molybdenum cofactor synthesis domain protein [Thermocrinis albus DSM 14484]|uniref:Molybdopterin molybdenumtransferase n=1 Tax=Thermocrinis albus (strain DSM 14484 / JCM 11386 / HI 11/12) TaxID=638303 RepID=D3SL45_THEAH|nr:gephyrin-like molybdotransferase Glp [Thermocrinis albus]ADC89475.1 molybdenum cofactor synthesis domain protein [Thermocrinis albus DSM 14484]